MKKLLLVIGLVGLSPLVLADTGLESIDPLVPFAFETITVSSTAVGFTSATYNPAAGKAKRAQMTCETNAIRYRYDGTAPTTTVGHVLAAGGALSVLGDPAIDNFRMIASGSDATCSVTYEK